MTRPGHPRVDILSFAGATGSWHSRLSERRVVGGSVHGRTAKSISAGLRASPDTVGYGTDFSAQVPGIIIGGRVAAM
jgi:hypothetical protein